MKKILCLAGLFIIALTLSALLSACAISPSGTQTPPTAVSTGSTSIVSPTETRVPTTAPTSIPPSPTASPTIAPTAGPTAVQVTPSSPNGPIPKLEPGFQLTITHIDIIDTSAGWALGGDGGEYSTDHVLYTGDGGNSWQDVTPPEPAPDEGAFKRASAAFWDAENAWVAYGSISTNSNNLVVWHTQDAGKNWQASESLELPADSPPPSPDFMQFIDPQRGWVLTHVGAGMMHDYVALFRTTDGGVTWQRVMDPNTTSEIQSFGKTGLVFVDENTGWMTRDPGGVVNTVYLDQTQDGGQDWQTQELPEPPESPDLYDQFFCGAFSPVLFSSQEGMLVITCHDMQDTNKVENFLYVTSDGGQSWDVSTYRGGNLQFLNRQTGWALGREIDKTQDGGKTWTKIADIEWDGKFDFVNENNAWAVAKLNGETALVVTSDGGEFWEQLNPVIAQ